MKIKLTTVYVEDQDKALRFYTDVLGFVKKADFSNGPYRWLTVASPEDPDGYRVVKLGDAYVGGVWQTADGTPPYWVAYFKYDDVDGGFERARELGGELMDEPNDSQYGRWATVRDPQGAVFRLISTNP